VAASADLLCCHGMVARVCVCLFKKPCYMAAVNNKAREARQQVCAGMC
jgi:hypothetical protein